MPTKSSRVCSDHFVWGKPTNENPDPELNLGYKKILKPKRKFPAVRLEIPTKCSKLDKSPKDIVETGSTSAFKEVNPNTLQSEVLDSCGAGEEIPPENNQSSGSTAHIRQDHVYCYGWTEMEDPNYCMNESCIKKRKEKDDKIIMLQHSIDELTQKLKESQKKLKERGKKSLSHADLKTDKSINLMTGIPNKAAFDALFSVVKDNVKKVNYWSGPSKSTRKGRNFKKSPKKFGPKLRSLTQKDEFLLTMMKLRLGSTNADLAQRFGMSSTNVSNIFTTWIKVLVTELRCLVYNPPIDVVKKTLPKRYRKPGYSKVRHIIDCTEIFIETPSDPALNAATWSDYKHHNTAKVLVSITPNGAFNFISDAWGGRTSDVYLTRESNFYGILEPQDEVMADRGFTIAEDLVVRSATLHIPPGKRGKEQFTKSQVKKTKAVANLRIFVEQAIRRLKTFRLIKHELPISLLSNIENIVIVCAAVCNLYKPLCKN